MKKIFILSLFICISSFSYILKDAKNVEKTQTMYAACQNFDNTLSDKMCLVKRKQLAPGKWGEWVIVGRKGNFRSFKEAFGQCCSSSGKK